MKKSLLVIFFVILNFSGLISQSTYFLGRLQYERKFGTEEEIRLSRIEGYQLIKEDSDNGFSGAQYYLATIHLSDPNYIDSLYAIELLKKSAFQRDVDAIAKLDELGVTDYIVPLDYRYWSRIALFAALILSYLLLSAVAHRKVNLSTMITQGAKRELRKLIWFLPIIGALIGLFKAKRIVQPIDEEDVQWVINSFSWIEGNFSNSPIRNKPVLGLGDLNNIYSENTKSDVKKLVHEIAEIMDIRKGLTSVSFYKENKIEQFGEIEVRQFEVVQRSTGKYYGKNKAGKFQIALEENLLNRPVNLVATIAHELSHTKLLGDERIEENDEYLTDLLPIAFGLGTFGANSIFNSDTNNYYWRMSKQGYLGEKIYAFALAWYAFLRKEKNPGWKKFLKPSILDEFETSVVYIENLPEAPTD